MKVGEADTELRLDEVVAILGAVDLQHAIRAAPQVDERGLFGGGTRV
jgi:hypothetical protein